MDAASLRPLGVGEILDVAIKLYRNRFATLVKAVAVVIGPVYLLFALIQLSIIPTADDIDAIDPATGLPETDMSDLWAILAAFAVLGIALFIASQLATAASFRIVSAGYLGDDVEWGESLRFATKRILALVWVSTLMAILLVIGIALCVIPGVYFYVAVSVVVPVLLVENVRGTRALKRSRSLVKGRWWPVAAVVVLAFVLTQIVAGTLSGVLGAASGASGNDLTAVIGNAIAGTVAAVLTTPFTAAVTTVVYFDLRVRKEGFDVELLARDVGVAPAPAGERPHFIPPPPPPTPPSGAEPPFWPPPPGWRPPDA